jgi:hypothetical protein
VTLPPRLTEFELMEKLLFARELFGTADRAMTPVEEL